MTNTIYTLQYRTQQFLNKSKLVHNNKYDYSLVEYINARTKVKIICPIHGIFEQEPRSHLSGQGCLKCGNDSKKTSLLNFINNAKLVHNDTYDYSLVEYKQTHKNIKIICSIHGIFDQTPHHHLHENGCSKCGNDKPGGYNLTKLNRDPKLANKLSSLYLIKHEHLYKVGITTLSAVHRFNKSINIISELSNIPLIEAFTKEQEILSKYVQFKEKPKNWKHSGDTEFLNINNEQKNQIIIDFYTISRQSSPARYPEILTNV